MQSVYWAFCLILGLGGMLLGCQNPLRSMEVPATAPATIGEPTPRPSTPTVAPTPSPVELLEVPPLYYVHHGQLFSTQAGESHVIATLSPFPDTGWIRVGSTLYWLDETTLQQVDLTNGEITTLHTFDTSTMGGTLRASKSGTLLFSRTIEDGNSPVGHSGEIWIYHPNDPAPTYITTIQGSFLLVGSSFNELAFYTIPLGQDPAFEEIELRNITNGVKANHSLVQGELFAIMSPDQRTILHGGYDCGEHPGDTCLPIFSIDGAYGTLLPQQAWGGASSVRHACAMDWRGEETTIVYILCEGNWYQVPKVYRGLYEWDLTSTESIALDERQNSPLALAFQDDTRITISADGAWLLAWHLNQSLAIAMHLPSNHMVEVNLPTPVTVVGWQ